MRAARSETNLPQSSLRKIDRSARRTNPPAGRGGAEIFAADLSDLQGTVAAVSGATVVCLLAGLKYDLTTWKELWPRIMANTIEACKQTQAKLIFFDNVYMYGRVDGPMTEQTPYVPCGKKGANPAARIASCADGRSSKRAISTP